MPSGPGKCTAIHLRRNQRSVTSAEKTLIVFALVVVVAFALVLSYSYLSAVTAPPRRSTQTVTSTVTAEFTAVSTTFLTGSSRAVSEFDAVAIYSGAGPSVVTVTGETGSGLVIGSGFVTSYQNSDYIVTNYHVIESASGLTVTFADGDSYPATVVGTDPYSDLAVLTASTSPRLEHLHPLSLYPSSFLTVGQTVLAIGAPFGLSGSMTVGIISQLGRTLQDPTAGNFSIAAAIQFSAPINPGNSGGPLLDSNGEVIGITTAVVQSSQGVGFAIPSDTIIRELPTLIGTGGYAFHPYLGVLSVSMNYQLSQAFGPNYTSYGVLIEQVLPGGPADRAGLVGGSRQVSLGGQQYLIGGDVIVSINGTRIQNYDSMATYLEERTLPGQTIQVGIIRQGDYKVIPLVLGARPPPQA